MKLTDHDLRQLDEEALRRLPQETLCSVSAALLSDLKEARERLRQNPSNSSRPPSSRAPWESREPTAEVPEPEPEEKALPEGAQAADTDTSGEADSPAPSGEAAAAPPARAKAKGAAKRRAGKQPGAPGVGRTDVLQAHATEAHRPGVCAICGRALPAHMPALAYTGFQSIDLRWDDPAAPGLRVWVVDHRYLEVGCPCCGHHTRAEPAQGEVPPELDKVRVGEWRLVGPGLASFIVSLSLRFRLSRARIRELLDVWLGIRLSIGTIHATLHEAAAVVAPADVQLRAELLAEELLHADETSWREHGRLLWLWVFVGATTTLYVIAGRGKATVSRLLGDFQGWLMSDGWFSYRDYPQRLRCWAHLLRKAQGLAECCDAQGSVFGHVVRETLEALMESIYAARDGPPPDATAVDLPSIHASRLAALRRACNSYLDYHHEKTRAFAVELLNDWEAIFRVLEYPHLPLTNNLAERTLRHWVIARRISYGTRTATGSRVFTLLASVIDTCRQRGHSPWLYLAEAIAERRGGRALPPVPQLGV